MRDSQRFLGLVLAFGVCSFAPKPLLAQSAAEPDANSDASHLVDEKALQTFKEGIAAFDRRDFEAARVAFLQTFALKPSAPVVRRNLGLAEIYSGHYLDGARRLARVLHTTGEGSPEDRARMVDSLKKAEAYLERLTVEVNEEGAEVFVDGTDLGPSPLPFVWYVSPGSYEVRVQKAGFEDFREPRQARAGGTQHLRVVLKPAAAAAPPPRSEAVPPGLTIEKHPNGWILASGGVLTVAGVAAGAAFSAYAANNADKVKSLRSRLEGQSCVSTHVPECNELLEASRAHDRQARYATISFVAAGVTGMVTLLYGLLGGDYDTREPEAGTAELPPPLLPRALAAGSFDGHGPYASWQTAF
ncbi:MAG TPA: PEGA domain-containing protein [Polyangiaceae bacterium]|nr:PEGA domain-containing protein [Polyangiaceae bacterium]